MHRQLVVRDCKSPGIEAGEAGWLTILGHIRSGGTQSLVATSSQFVNHCKRLQ